MENSFVLCDTTAMETAHPIEPLGTFIRRNRLMAQLTQRELATAIGMTDRTVSDWESGRSIPGRDAIERMTRFFRVPIEEFFLRIRPEDPVEEEVRKIGRAHV